MKKPILVIILVVVFMLGGIKMLSSGIGWLKGHESFQLLIDNLEELKSGDDASKQLSNGLEIPGMLLKHHTLVGIIQMVIGLFIMVSAFYLFRLRAWARIGLEIISWFWLAWAAVCCVFVIFIWKKSWPMFEEMWMPSPTEIPEFTSIYNNLIYISVFIAVILSVAILMIILLRWKTVRNAVKAGSIPVNTGPV